MNTVRKHLSAIKGGRLAAAAAPAKVVALMISDVPGDDPSIIASGPTVPDPSTNKDALGIIEKYAIDVPKAVLERLRKADETPKPGDKRLASVENIMIATPQASLEAAAEVARKAGVTPVILGDSIEGESRDVALVHAGIARQCALRGQPQKPPCVLISGGETTITLKGKGKGGRNTEFLLALAIALDGMKNIYAIAGDTDGVDGSEDNAGALIYPDTLARAAKAGINAKAMLADNDPVDLLQRDRRSAGHRPDAHQRQRLPRGADREGLSQTVVRAARTAYLQIGLTDHRVAMSAFGELVAAQRAGPEIDDGSGTADAPEAPRRIAMRAVPHQAQHDAGAGALRAIGEIGIERSGGIIPRHSRVMPSAGLVELNLGPRGMSIIEFCVAQSKFSTWVKAAFGSWLAAMTALQAITTKIGGICTDMARSLFKAPPRCRRRSLSRSR